MEKAGGNHRPASIAIMSFWVSDHSVTDHGAKKGRYQAAFFHTGG